MNCVILLPYRWEIDHLVVMTDELLLPVYESFCILKTLAFGDHFCGSFGKPKN